MSLSEDDKTWIVNTIESIVRNHLNNYRQEVNGTVNKAIIQHTHSNHPTPISVLESKIVGNEAKIVLMEKAQKNFNERLDSIEETVADEVGRAQDIAKEARDEAERANHTANSTKGNSNWTVDLYDRDMINHPWTTMAHQIAMKPATDSSPTMMINALTANQYQTLSQSGVPEVDDAVQKIEGVFKQPNSISELSYSRNPINNKDSLFVKGDERNVEFTRLNLPNSKWQLSEVKENIDNKISKSKKKGKK